MNTLQSEPTSNESAKSLGFKYGLIWAGINIVLFLLIYYGMPQLLGTWKQSAVQTIIGIGLAIYFTLEIRKQIGGFWTFREAISSIFILFIVPVVTLFFFALIFGKWIDPGYNERITQTTLNTTTELMENFSTDQDLIDKTIADMELALEDQLNPSFGTIIKALGMSVLMYFIMAMIWAAIFKRDRPIFLNQSESEDLS